MTCVRANLYAYVHAVMNGGCDAAMCHTVFMEIALP